MQGYPRNARNMMGAPMISPPLHLTFRRYALGSPKGTPLRITEYMQGCTYNRLLECAGTYGCMACTLKAQSSQQN